MKFKSLTKWIFAALMMAAAVPFAFAQQAAQTPYQSQELSDGDGIPVLIKHLPNWENLRDRTAFVRDTAALKAALGERPIFDLVDFSAGTEAVTAPYQAGKLLIIEYTTPQVSVESDAKFIARLGELGDTTTVYRRIGNYSVFVFDGTDTAAATELLEQVKYEKNVQWLGDDPYYLKRAERAFINTTSGIFTSTVFVILIGIGLAITGGLIVGITYFTLRVRRRAAMTAYTDAGGMTRLNLDGFTPDIVPERLLGE
ncbi:MAG: hypothetical protein KA746_00465 [Pyrinomonadaceae bacterium]|nr:hypothetical protein [Pyrinomonadaceae bacterium]MBP6213983.1 hypothetical protein [Pyrinomonadaceae bacterium]